MLNPALLAALGNILPATSILTASEDTRPYECDGLTLFREEPNAFQNLGLRFPGRDPEALPCRAAACRRARRRHRLVGRGASRPQRHRPVARQVHAHPGDRPAFAHGDRPAGCAQSGDLRGCGGAWPVLCARSVVADRVHNRRQRRRKFRGCALPQVRAHAAQPASRPRRAHYRRGGRVRQRGARRAGL